MILGRISGQLRNLLSGALDRRGLVVWYDPQRVYGELVDHLDLDVKVVRYDDGFFRLFIPILIQSIKKSINLVIVVGPVDMWAVTVFYAFRACLR